MEVAVICILALLNAKLPSSRSVGFGIVSGLFSLHLKQQVLLISWIHMDNRVLITSESALASSDSGLVSNENGLVSSDHSLVIGQEFPDVETCRRTLKDIAIAMRFEIRTVKSDRSRFIAKCSKEGCPWRVHVAKCPGVSTFSIRTLHGEHTCEGVRNLHHQQASVGWVARSVEARIRDNPQYKPKDILQDIQEQHGVAVSYMQAWRGKERSMAAVHGTYEEGYRLLPAYCEQIRKTNPGSIALNAKLVNIFWNAVYALTSVEFEKKVSEMVEISQDVIQWFQHFPPRLWALAYFEGVRYGHFSLGITELLYKWALDSHELPIVQMMEHIRYQLTSWFNERRTIGMGWNSILVPTAEKCILEAIADARCYQVLRANEVEFEIVSSERTNIVDIRNRECSCRRWQLYGLPCAHATAALISCGQNAHVFAEPCFSVVSYCETYSQIINPIPDKNFWRENGEGTEGGGAKLDMTVRAPKTRRPPGRPKRMVLRIESFKRPKRVFHFMKCNIGRSPSHISFLFFTRAANAKRLLQKGGGGRDIRLHGPFDEGPEYIDSNFQLPFWCFSRFSCNDMRSTSSSLTKPVNTIQFVPASYEKDNMFISSQCILSGRWDKTMEVAAHFEGNRVRLIMQLLALGLLSNHGNIIRHMQILALGHKYKQTKHNIKVTYVGAQDIIAFTLNTSIH
ncbi:Zinc finger, SWIM-type [Dillenia turbinata]|uniref:Zinc finger, SWIM-type n=1 Tax=Dillenia turbinata TaxID=194707 RepID=A0AAN8V8P1_9MAGN